MIEKKKFVVGISLVIFILLVVNGCTNISAPQPQEGIILEETKTEEKLPPSETPATSPMKIDLSLSRAPTLGETAEVIAIINYTGKIKENMPETTANIILPDGFELINGNSTWNGYLKKEPIQFSITVKAVQTGNWTIEAKARKSGKEHTGGGFDYVYVSVLEDKGIISKESFPLSKREGSDRAIKMDELEIPPETEPLSDENITTPKPTEPILSTIIPPMKIDLSLSRAPTLGETAEVIAIINYTGKIKENMPETTANIILPDGFELINGNSTWNGYLKKEPIQFSITVKAVQTGNWTIEAKARKSGKEHTGGGFDYVYVSVLEDKGIISKESFPLSKREGSDRAIKMDESEIPPEKIISVKEGIIKPHPTIRQQNFNIDDIQSILKLIVNEDIGPPKISEALTFSSKSITMLSPGTVTVKGRFFYKDRNNVSQPLRWATVWIWDDDISSADDYLGAFLTGTDGRFESSPIDNNDPEGGTQDIYVQIIAGSGAAEVDGSTNGENIYDGFTSTTNNVSDGTHDIGDWLTPTSNDEKPAWWVYENLLDGWNYFKNTVVPSYLMSKQVATWRLNHNADYGDGSSGTHYHLGGDIHLDGTTGFGPGGGHANDEDVILHEYGHAVMYNVYGNYMPPTPNCSSHYIDAVSSGGCAWVEGWANFVPLIVFNNKIFNDTTQDFEIDFESRTPDAPWDNGDQVEGNIAASLWDFSDDSSEDAYNGNFNNHVWNTAKRQNNDNLSHYWTAWQDDHTADEENNALIVLAQDTIYYATTEISCANGIDEDGDGYTDCADGDCTQGSLSANGFCCGSGCSVNGGSCANASKSGFTCTDGNCNTYTETCQNGELESSLLCSGTSLSCSGGSCEYGFSAPQWCDEITPSDTVCENSPGSSDELACEVSGTNCYYEAEYSCTSPSGCDEKDQDVCSTNSGFQCEWQGTYGDNVVEECESTTCGAISQCDEQLTGYEYSSCTTSGQNYFADKCSSSCQGTDRGDNICRTSAFATGCTADAQCNGVTAGTGNCTSSCFYDIPPTVALVSPINNYLSTSSSISFNCSAVDDYMLVNITLYHNLSGIWSANETRLLTNTSDYETFTINNLPDKTNFIWNCLVYDNTSKLDWGDINFSINVSYVQSNLTISSFIDLYTNKTDKVFEFILQNPTSTALNVSWSIDMGDNTIINSNQNATLQANEKLLVYVEYNYSNKGLYTINATARAGNITAFANISAYVGDIIITELSEVYSSRLNRLFAFTILNNENSALTNINWSLNTSEQVIYANYPVNLSAGERLLVFVEYNYTNYGTYNLIAAANASAKSHSKTIAVSVLPPLNIYNFSQIYDNGLNNLFGFRVNDDASWQINFTNLNWSFNTGESTIYANMLTSITSNESVLYYIEYNYTNQGEYLVNVTVYNGTYSNSENITVEISPINLYDLSNIYSNSLNRLFGFKVNNRDSWNINVSNLNWTFDTGESNISAKLLTQIAKNETILYYIEYNYTNAGTYNINATATNGTYSDSEQMQITVS